MSGFLLLTITSQWHTMIVDAGRDHSTPVIFADSNGYPVIAVGVGDWWNNRSEFRWTGDKWLERPIPFKFDIDKIRLDRNDFLHIKDPEAFYAIDYHQTDSGWAAWVNDKAGGSAFTVDSFNMPHFLAAYRHFYVAPDSTWVTDTPPAGYIGDLPMAVTDPFDNIHVMSYDMTMTGDTNLVKYAFWSDSSWTVEIVDKIPMDSGDFCFSNLWIYADPFGKPHLIYIPYMCSESDYRPMYAWKDSLGNWRTERYRLPDGRRLSMMTLKVDSLGIRHTVTPDSTGIYHVIRYPWERVWRVRERIDTCSSASRRAMAIDRFGYLHLVFTDGSDYTLYYATTNPDIGITESLPEPKPRLSLSVAPNPVKGLLKLQYGIPLEDEGLVSLKIYDVSGRSVQTVFSEEKSADYYDLAVPVNSFSAGTYFLRLEAGTKAITKKVVIR